MSEPLVLIVLVGASDPTTDAMLETTRRALGPDAVVLADTSREGPLSSDDQALAIGERVHARAVARVSWSDSAVAHLHVHLAPGGGWTDEDLAFAAQDPSAERGRALGYTLASMVQRLEHEPAPEPGEPPPATPPPAERALPLRLRANDVDVFASATLALDPRAGIGAAGGARWWFVPRIGARVAIGARATDLADARSSALAVYGAVGLGYRASVGAGFDVGPRIDLLVLRQSVTRRSGDHDETRGRWLGATHFVLEGGWAVHPSFAVTAGVGAEVAFGATDVHVGGEPVAELPSLRGLVELGGRFRF